jgi:hypothetical protein
MLIYLLTLEHGFAKWMQLMVSQIKAEMEKTLRWLVPIANNTTKYSIITYEFFFNYKSCPHLTENVIVCSYQGTPWLWLGWRVGKYRVSL